MRHMHGLARCLALFATLVLCVHAGDYEKVDPNDATTCDYRQFAFATDTVEVLESTTFSDGVIFTGLVDAEGSTDACFGLDLNGQQLCLVPPEHELSFIAAYGPDLDLRWLVLLYSDNQSPIVYEIDVRGTVLYALLSVGTGIAASNLQVKYYDSTLQAFDDVELYDMFAGDGMFTVLEFEDIVVGPTVSNAIITQYFNGGFVSIAPTSEQPQIADLAVLQSFTSVSMCLVVPSTASSASPPPSFPSSTAGIYCIEYQETDPVTFRDHFENEFSFAVEAVYDTANLAVSWSLLSESEIRLRPNFFGDSAETVSLTSSMSTTLLLGGLAYNTARSTFAIGLAYDSDVSDFDGNLLFPEPSSSHIYCGVVFADTEGSDVFVTSSFALSGADCRVRDIEADREGNIIFGGYVSGNPSVCNDAAVSTSTIQLLGTCIPSVSSDAYNGYIAKVLGSHQALDGLPPIVFQLLTPAVSDASGAYTVHTVTANAAQSARMFYAGTVPALTSSLSLFGADGMTDCVLDLSVPTEDISSYFASAEIPADYSIESCPSISFLGQPGRQDDSVDAITIQRMISKAGSGTSVNTYTFGTLKKPADFGVIQNRRVNPQATRAQDTYVAAYRNGTLLWLSVLGTHYDDQASDMQFFEENDEDKLVVSGYFQSPIQLAAAADASLFFAFESVSWLADGSVTSGEPTTGEALYAAGQAVYFVVSLDLTTGRMERASLAFGISPFDCLTPEIPIPLATEGNVIVASISYREVMGGVVFGATVMNNGDFCIVQTVAFDASTATSIGTAQFSISNMNVTVHGAALEDGDLAILTSGSSNDLIVHIGTPTSIFGAVPFTLAESSVAGKVRVYDMLLKSGTYFIAFGGPSVWSVCAEIIDDKEGAVLISQLDSITVDMGSNICTLSAEDEIILFENLTPDAGVGKDLTVRQLDVIADDETGALQFLYAALDGINVANVTRNMMSKNIPDTVFDSMNTDSVQGGAIVAFNLVEATSIISQIYVQETDGLKGVAAARQGGSEMDVVIDFGGLTTGAVNVTTDVQDSECMFETDDRGPFFGRIDFTEPSPSSTPSASASSSRSSTPSETPSNSETPSMTPTPTPSRTGTVTPTNTPTASVTATVTPTGSVTPSVTPTKTTTSTMTASVTSTPSGTSSHTATSSMSPSGSNSISVSSTITPTETMTSTKTAASTPTPSNSPTATASTTTTTSATATTTSSSSVSPTSSVSGTATPSPTSSTTMTTTASATAVKTPTPSVSMSRTLSRTATGSLSTSTTESASMTGSMTRSPTGTATPSGSDTATSARTVSVTSSATSTSSGTKSPSISPTTTESAIATSTQTPSSLSTKTASKSSTESASGTVSPSATLSLSVTASMLIPTPSAERSSTTTTSSTISGTSSATTSISSFATISATQSVTQSVSPTQSPTETAFATSSPSSSSSATLTPTTTSSSTATTTSLPTVSPTASQTASATPVTFMTSVSGPSASDVLPTIVAEPPMPTASRSPFAALPSASVGLSANVAASATRSRTRSAALLLIPSRTPQQVQIVDGDGGTRECEVQVQMQQVAADGRVTFACGGDGASTFLEVVLANRPASEVIVVSPGDEELIRATVTDVTIGSPVVDVVPANFDTGRETAEICLALDPATGGDAEDACLGFIDESVNPPEWRCEDFCLSARNDGLVCGETDHFTNFAILLDGAGAGDGDRCSSSSTDWITGKSWGDAVLVASFVVAAVACMVVWVLVLTLVKPARSFMLGAEGERVKLLRGKSSAAGFA